MFEKMSTAEGEPDVLSFEEFSRWYGPTPRYNNFFLHFDGGFGGQVYREKDHYLRFAEEYPALAERLCQKIQNGLSRVRTAKELKPVERDLYEAYKIMRGFGFSDVDLFA